MKRFDNMINRRIFIKSGVLAGMGLLASDLAFSMDPEHLNLYGKRVGIIGLDTSHSTAFAKLLNTTDTDEYKGYKVTAAYPYGSRTIESSYNRIPGYIDEVKKYNVEIVDSIEALLKKTDVILLETNDGRLHMEQALPVFKAGKRVFIDKPVAASLADAIRIYRAAADMNVPVFSASSLRYMSNIDKILNEDAVGKVLGAHSFSPCTLEATHPDLFWYGIHGVEALFTVMGPDCKTVTRIHTTDTDLVTGIWPDSRIGSFRGLRKGKTGYGGHVFGEKGIMTLGDYNGYIPLLRDIISFFETGIVPVTPEETLAIFKFMEAADESKRRNGAPVSTDEIWYTANKNVKKTG
ncbi:MAG: Gfo/Idh/MocA family oxidoreductase [Tannerella sp.]|jgi:predicted dehydrogenase|nr:Gfo/Idh/MocA family oxidoreductase [Tannerella sp.]